MSPPLARLYRTMQANRIRRRAARSLRLERLEDRAVPATIFWDGGPTGNGTNWLTPANWVGDILPGPGDDAIISTGAGGAIGLTASTSVRSVTSTRTIQITGGTLSIGAAASTFSNLTLTTGTLDAADGASLISSTVNGPTTLTVSSGRTLTLSSTTVSAPFVNQGTVLAFGASALSGALTSGAATTIRVQGGVASGTATLTVPGFVNNGLIELTSTDAAFAATLTVSSGALTNAAGATLSVLPGAGGTRTLNLNGGSRLDNQGAFIIGAATAITRNGGAGAASANSGTIAVTGGDLTLTQANADALTNTGTITVPAGRTLTVSGGTLNDQAGSSISGAGIAAFTSATFALGQNFSIATIGLALNNSTINGPGTLTIPAGMTLTLPSSTVSAPLVNQGTVLALGISALSGAVTSSAGSTIRALGNAASGAATLSVPGMVNNGLIELTSADAALAVTLKVSGGVLTNSAGGTLSVLPGAGGTRAVNLTAASRLDNQGVFSVGAATALARSGGATSASTNAGTIAVTGGDLTLTQAGADALANTGAIIVTAGNTFTISGGSLSNFAVGALIGGTYNLAGTFSFPGAAITTVSANLTLDGASSAVLDSVTSADGLTNLASITSAGRLALANGRNFIVAGAFANSGALSVGAGSTFTSAAGLTNVLGATLGGGGIIAANVSGAGAVSPGNSPGLLTVNGNVNLGGPLVAELGGNAVGTGYDQLLVSGAVILSGATLSASRNFVSAPDDTFVVIANDGTDAVTGTFVGLAEGAITTIGGRPFRISYAGGSNNNDVVLTQLNSSPTLATIGNKTVDEGIALTFTANGSDLDVPPQTLTYSLDAGAPAGATINPVTGIFSWTPTETQGPGAFSITVRVSDDYSTPASAFETISVTVNEVNQAPVLNPIGNKMVNELSALTFTATASDPDLPANTLTFSLDVGAPAGASINPTTGAFIWTPTEAQGPGTFPITVRVTDNGTPALSAFETISVTVNEVNQAPVLNPIGNKMVNELSALTFTATASDPDLPANTLTFSLDAGAPAGASINPTTGAFIWTPTEAQGPGTFPITIRVTDNGTPALSAFETISVTVNEVNLPPILAPINDITVNEGSPAAFTASATDPDLPANTLTFSLDPGFPTGATINPTTGAFSYTPPDGPAISTITVRVTDNGTPSLSATRTFTVTALNVNPTITPAGPVVAPLSGFTSSGSFTDPGADTFTGTVNYGDGTGNQPLAIDQLAHTFSLNHVYTAAGPYSVSITVVDDDGGIGTSSRQVTIVAPPQVAGTQINDGSAQRSRVTSLKVTFNTLVSFTSTAGAAFTLARNADGAAVTFTATATVVGGATVVTLTNFGGAAAQFGSLADGRYTLTALAGQISANGQALDGNGDGTPGDNYTFGDTQGLFRFFGDINGDRHVDIADLGLFSSTFNLSTGQLGFIAAFDFNGDGHIDIADLGQFSIRFFTVLP